MEREHIKLTWDQFETIKRIVETIEQNITEYDDVQIMKAGIVIKANQQDFTITFEYV
jgi:hypothetical protein